MDNLNLLGEVKVLEK